MKRKLFEVRRAKWIGMGLVERVGGISWSSRGLLEIRQNVLTFDTVRNFSSHDINIPVVFVGYTARILENHFSS